MTTRWQDLLFLMAQHEDGVPFYGMIFFINFGKHPLISYNRYIGGISSDTGLETLLQRRLSLPLYHVILKVTVFSNVTS
jgi:hypothetical protein